MRGATGNWRSDVATEPLRDIIARHGLQASKALGQNFILDRQLLARIAAIPGPLEGQTAYEVGPGPGGLTHALLEAGANVVAVERDRRCIPALAELETRLSRTSCECIDADALSDRRARRSRRRSACRLQPALQCRNGAAAALAQRSVAALVAIADADVPARSGRADRRCARQQGLRPAVDPRPVAIRRADRDERAPLGLRAAAEGDVGGRAHRAARRCRRASTPAVLERLTEAAFGQRRKMLRSSLKELPGALDALARARDRQRAPRRNGQRRRIRGDRPRADGPRAGLIASSELTGGLADATVGPRVIVAESSASCGQPLGQSFCSLARFSLARATAPSSTIASPWMAIASRSFGSSSERLLREADRLAEQLLPLSDPGERDIGRAVARIDGQRGFERLVGLDEPARRKMRIALLQKLDRPRQDLVVRPLADGGSRRPAQPRHRQSEQGQESAFSSPRARRF